VSREARWQALARARLIFVTDRHRTRLPLTQVVARALDGGLPAVIVRERDLDEAPFSDLAKTISDLATPRGALTLVTNRVEVAAAHRLAGVQLGAGGGTAEEARRDLGEEALIGLSIHSAAEADDARLGEVDYLIAAPVFATDSHPGRRALGVEALAELCRRTTRPVFALGGIGPENVRSCLEAGAHGVAVVGAIAAGYDPRGASKSLLRLLT
jgi:thiamine-phosphate pyrophosphorylase